MKNIAKRLTLLVASLTVGLLAGEAVVRMFYEPAPAEMDDFRLSKSPYYKADAELPWVPRNNVVGRHDRQGLFSSSFSTNSRGLRDGEHQIQKPAGTERVVVLGDSFTWGWGVNDGEVYPRRMEEHLRATEVINLGVTAFALRDSIVYFKREGLQYEPDVVVVGFCLNDIYREMNEEDERGARPATSVEARRGFRLKEFLATSSALYKLTVDRVNANKKLSRLLVKLGIKESLVGFEGLDTSLKPALLDYPPRLTDSFEQTKAELLELQAITDALGSRLVIALVPSRQSVERQSLLASIAYTEFDVNDFDLEKPYRIIDEFGTTHGIEVVNPFPRFHEAAEAGASLYLKGDMHFNAAGHDLFARAVAQHLATQK
jgi:lysophospholipase L1-like esterase